LIDNGELPEKSHRLEIRRNLQIEIIALAKFINLQNIAKKRNPRVRAT